MSEFKFACPVCGQHITCAAGTSGSQMDCPTCFRKLVVPQPPAAGATNLVLSASEVTNRPGPVSGADLGGTPAAKQQSPVIPIVVAIVLCAAGAGAFIFRDKIFKSAQLLKPFSRAAKTTPAASPEVPPASDTNWTLNLAAVAIPEAPAAGRINGRSFQHQKATIRGGMLILWQGPKWPPEAGMAVGFFAKQAEDLAGKTIIIEATRTNAPRLMVRWQDEPGQSETREFQEGYALRVEFGDLAGSRLPGRIYLAAPDDEKSYLTGTFDAEIHRPSHPKTKPSN